MLDRHPTATPMLPHSHGIPSLQACDNRLQDHTQGTCREGTSFAGAPCPTVWLSVIRAQQTPCRMALVLWNQPYIPARSESLAMRAPLHVPL